MNRSEFHFSKSTLAVVIPPDGCIAPLANAQREIATGIEEVVVTAQKREENLQEVPLAVTALTLRRSTEPSPGPAGYNR